MRFSGPSKKPGASYYERKTYLFSLIGGEICRWCRSTESIQFDHDFPETKAFELASKGYTLKAEGIAEALKCQPLCKSCHVLKTALERTPRPINMATVTTVGSRAGNQTPEQKQLAEELRRELWEDMGIRL